MDTRTKRASWRTPSLLLAGALIAVVAFVATSVGSGAAATHADPSLDSEEQAFVQLINDYRAQNNLGPLLIDSSLTNASDWMSGDMGAQNYFDHNDAQGRDPWTRMCDFNYCYNTWKGENIAAGYSTAAQVFQGWRNSPGHNSNMLGSHYVVMGLARVQTPGSTYGWYWTNDFGGYQAESSPPPAPTNTPSPTVTTPPTEAPTAAPTAAPTDSPAPTPTATPTMTPTPSPSPTATPTATPSPTPTAQPTSMAQGAADLDCDAEITGLDSLALLRFLTGLDQGDGSCPPVGVSQAQGFDTARPRGDVDCTGTINSFDALSILRYAAGDHAAVLQSC